MAVCRGDAQGGVWVVLVSVVYLHIIHYLARDLDLIIDVIRVKTHLLYRVVCFVQRHYEEDWLGGTFSAAIFVGNGLVAIVSGLVAHTLVEALGLGAVAPFDAAHAVLLLGGVVVLATWTENYGEEEGSGRVPSLWGQIWAAVRAIQQGTSPAPAWLHLCGKQSCKEGYQPLGSGNWQVLCVVRHLDTPSATRQHQPAPSTVGAGMSGIGQTQSNTITRYQVISIWRWMVGAPTCASG